MKLIFVYNADSGALSAMFDIGHKILSPDTYKCNLCKITYGNFREEKKWKEYREKSLVDMEFLHKDEFEKLYGLKFEYPVVLKQTGSIDVIVTKDILNNLKNIDALIDTIKKHIKLWQEKI